MLSKAITWLKDWFGSSLLRRDTHRATDDSAVTYLTPERRAEEQRKVNKFYSDVLARAHADQRNMKLVAIARQRLHLKEQLEQAKRQKKARRHLYAALEALTREELRIEAGK